MDKSTRQSEEVVLMVDAAAAVLLASFDTALAVNTGVGSCV